MSKNIFQNTAALKTKICQPLYDNYVLLLLQSIHEKKKTNKKNEVGNFHSKSQLKYFITMGIISSRYTIRKSAQVWTPCIGCSLVSNFSSDIFLWNPPLLPSLQLYEVFSEKRLIIPFRVMYFYTTIAYILIQYFPFISIQSLRKLYSWRLIFYYTRLFFPHENKAKIISHQLSYQSFALSKWNYFLYLRNILHNSTHNLGNVVIILSSYIIYKVFGTWCELKFKSFISTALNQNIVPMSKKHYFEINEGFFF